jgi:hypothetical protein
MIQHRDVEQLPGADELSRQSDVGIGRLAVPARMEVY